MDELYGQEWGSYNLSWLIFIPKGEAEQDAQQGAYHTAKNTRPISIVNCDNRILAGAARLAWEPMMNSEIHESQRGFLKGRSMLANVVDNELSSMAAAAEGPGHATIYFDFRAAFPSISHEFLEDAMAARGIPEKWGHFLKHLYQDNGCLIPLGGQTHEGFRLTSGIRQGCPLSPLLFAAALDFFLRRLCHEHGEQACRAFADDIALTVKDLLLQAPGLAHEFRQLEKASGMGTNMDKTVIIPLFPTDLANFRARVEERVPDWKGIACSYKAKYLGFMMGPEKAQHQWSKVREKMKNRAKDWAAAGLGTYLTCEAYRIYIASVASFLGQLTNLPADWDDTEKEIISILFPGPYRWLPAEVAHSFGSMGLHRNLADIRLTAWAAKLRVSEYENRRQDGLKVQQRANDLMTKLHHSGQIYMRALWKEWLEDAFISRLQQAREEARAIGITKTTVQAKTLGHEFRPQGEEELDKCRRGFQNNARKMLEERNKPNMENTLRKKLSRWQTGLFPRLLAPRLQHGLQVTGRRGAPRVAAALLRANLNGWVTERRMQTRGGCGCGLGCPGAEDSIEHYARCPRLWDIARTRLRIQRPGNPEADTRMFLGLDRDISDDNRLKMALLVYGTYKYLNEKRHRTIPTNQGPSFIWQSMKNGARGNRFTEDLLDNIWVQRGRGEGPGARQQQ